ncbi:MAG: hypothetical protein AAFR28_05245 [Pseudomonadota bacterium]
MAAGYEIRSGGLTSHQTGSKLSYVMATTLVKDGDVVQCLQQWDAYYQEETHRCVRIAQRTAS